MPEARPSRRLSDIAAITPVFGFIFLIPPVIDLFLIEGKIFGAPVILVYLFSVWIGLIVVAALLSRMLSHEGKSDQS